MFVSKYNDYFLNLCSAFTFLLSGRCVATARVLERITATCRSQPRRPCRHPRTPPPTSCQARWCWTPRGTHILTMTRAAPQKSTLGCLQDYDLIRQGNFSSYLQNILYNEYLRSIKNDMLMLRATLPCHQNFKIRRRRTS